MREVLRETRRTSAESREDACPWCLMNTVCPVCEYPRCDAHYRMKDRFFGVSGEEFLLFRCHSCGLLFQQEKEIAGRLKDFYPPGYWWEEANGSTLERRYREWVLKHDQLGFLLSLIPEPKNYRLLDIGCGAGTFVKLAGKSGLDACGLEESEEAARIAQRNQVGKIFQCSVHELAEHGEQFDILTLFHCLEHVLDPFRFLRGLQKLLRKPGRIIVQVPNSESLQAMILGSSWYGLDCPRHIYNYSTFSLMHLLGRTGYRIHRVRHFSLRDNAAALISSLFPSLDPTSQRVKLKRRHRSHSLGFAVKEMFYLNLLLLAQPLALLEAGLGRGATLTVYATVD